MVKHVAGAANKTADWLSRLFIPHDKEHLIASMQDQDSYRQETGAGKWTKAESSVWGDHINRAELASLVQEVEQEKQQSPESTDQSLAEAPR